ncbi:lysylphosphatidylglycerol synthase domain-containing protein [Olivibacter sp. XZL3]|uniref:lysylphosphatidylglycerol synthase domain-containing protein n=1 Tax=Olivibacter sp. XZL3 TaxID=1735116 RepID=UPI0010646BE3|nr:lysylphosphatidylglycerol synthase domain-containing protein [Olivibacter sp. XZL3]
MLRVLKVILFLSVGISLALYARHFDSEQLFQSVKLVGWNFCWILVLTSLAYLFGTIAWAYCLGQQRKQITIYRLFWVRLIGETVSLFNPGSIIGGDFLKIELLKPYRIERTVVIKSVVVSRFLMIVSQLLLSALALPFLLYRGDEDSGEPTRLLYTYLTVALSLAGLLLVFFFCLIKPGWAKYSTFSNKYLDPFHLTLNNTIYETRKYYRLEKKALLLSFLFFILHWLTGSLEFLLILQFLNIDVHVAESLAMDMGVIFFKSAGAIIPGQIGVEEYGNQFMLRLVGITGSIWLSVSVLRRVRQFIWLFLGGISYLVYHKGSANFQAL